MATIEWKLFIPVSIGTYRFHFLCLAHEAMKSEFTLLGYIQLDFRDELGERREVLPLG